MKYLTKIKLISVTALFAAVCIAFGVSSAISARKAARAGERAAALNLQSAVSLCESVKSIENLLLESAFASRADRLGQISCELASLCGSARAELAGLSGETGEIKSYLLRVYSLALNSEIGGERSLSLAQDAAKIYTSSSLAAEKMLNGGSGFAYKNAGVSPGEAGEAAARASKGDILNSLGEITRDEAAQRAAEFCSAQAVLMRDAEPTSGAVELYNFTCSGVSVSVTKRGGLIYSYSCPVDCGAAVLSADDARRRAAQTAAELGYEDLVCNESRVQACSASFVFVREQNGVPCLADTVEIGVCLEKGCVFSVDASGYILNSHLREAAELEFSRADALRLTPPGAAFESARLVYAEFDGQESVCCEIICSMGGKKAAVYFDAASFEEKKVKILN